MHGIKVATTLTGLSDHVIRVWEKRYNAVIPHRTDTNRRLYSDADISRLQILAKLVKHGCAISNIANLPDSELHSLWESITDSEQATEPAQSEKIQSIIADATKSVRSFDQQRLEKVFDEASRDLGYSGLLEFVIIPIMQQVGNDWFNGTITSAGEHAATSFIKEYLSHSVRAFSIDKTAPVIIVTTPAGQLHDLSAYIGSCIARKAGWKVIYLGASLPANEIAGAIHRVNADALLMSIVFPLDDSKLPGELIQLRKQCPASLPILIGGSGLGNYQQTLNEINAISVTKISGLSAELLKIRQSRVIKPQQPLREEKPIRYEQIN